MDKIARIRQEIERLKKENDNIKCSSNKAYCQGYGDAFVDLLPFLDTISEEPDKEDLNDEIKKFIEEYGYERGGDRLLIAIVARHFAQWGAEHLKK